MAHPRGNNRSRSGSMAKTGPSAQILLIELKQRILSALNKLADRDTQQIAVEDLERIAETLSPDGISLCLSCLYDTDAQQKSAVRKECVKMFGTLASLHADLLSPHLPKIVSNIALRLRDPDSIIRDACIDTMGALAAKVVPPPCSGNVSGGADNGGLASFSGPLGVFVKPLFDVLNEQNRSAQVGAAMCLARVIECVRDPPLGALQRLCPRITKNLSNPNFAAKAALLTVVGSIIQAGGATSYQCLTTLMTCVQEALKSTDWATRKSASETLACIASSIGSALGSFKTSVLDALESCRFDKVKPVRDCIIQTLQIWKDIPSLEGDLWAPDRMSAVKENALSESADRNLQSRRIDAMRQSAPVLQNLTSVNFSFQDLENSYGFRHARSAPNKITGNIQKKRTPLTDKKTNPDFFKKLDKKDSADWQVKVNLPHVHTPTLQHEDLDGNMARSQGGSMCQEKKVVLASSAFGHSSLEEDTDIASVCQEEELGKKSETSDDSLQNACTKGQKHFFKEKLRMSGLKNRTIRPKVVNMDAWLDPSSNEHGEGEVESCTIVGLASTTGTSGSSDGHFTYNNSGLAAIQRQLRHIELQQSNLLELVQELMSTSQESLLGLDSRVRGLESVVNHLAGDISTGRYEGVTSRCCGRFLPGADLLSSKFRKRNESWCSLQDRSVSPEAVPFGVKEQNIPVGNVESARKTYEESKYAPTARTPTARTLFDGNQGLETQANSWRVHVDVSSDNVQRRARDEVDGGLHVTRKGRDRGLGFTRLGEGPSARSVWQASNDEATLAAIRFAGEDTRLKVESLKAPVVMTRSTTALRSEAPSHKIGGQGKGPFWSLWTRAAGFLHSGDTDSAYIEVLCAGDELLLVRLMSRTGPVLEQLSSGTVVELLQTIIQLLLQQSFLDIIIPWIQQVADLVIRTGSECLGIPLDAKRELVASLREASILEFPELWIGKTLEELALQLADCWGIVTQSRGAA